MRKGPVGFVGIGNMGGPMVRRLLANDYAVRLYDVRPEVTATLAAEPGVEVAKTLVELGAGLEIVITMLPDSKIVRAATFGQGRTKGFADQMKKGGLVVDMSSSFPLDTRSLAEELAPLGLAVVDAPVSGGVGKAVTGTLAIMTGGADADVDRVAPVLSAMGQIHRTGALGSGHALKALNNYVSAAGLIATCEALAIGQRFGLDPHVMTGVLNASTGKNNTTENKVERFMLNGKFDSGFALALMEKDVGMAARLAERIGTAAPELSVVHEQLADALAELGREADHTAVYRFVMERKD
ncbi:MAG: NAD(P)-dependent oxidoreductase [Hyphomicrobiaceae bacterium]